VEYFHHVRRIRYLSRTYVFDLLIALLLFAAMLEVLVGRHSGAPDAPHGTLWFVLPAIAILFVPFVARRWFPFAPGAHWLLAAGIAFVDWRLIPFAISIFVLGLVAAFLLGNLRDPVQAGLGLALVVGGPATVVYKIPGHTAAMMIFIPLEFAIAWVAGFALRGRSAQAEAAEVRAAHAERERDAAARIAVAEERVRIARELHDTVAHSMATITVQAGSALHLLDGGDTNLRRALTAIRATSKEALGEMRATLGQLRTAASGDPQTLTGGLDRLPALRDAVTAAGAPVTIEIEGEQRPLPPAVDQAAYRILQESLTNVLRHAGPAARATVSLRYGPASLAIRVTDDGGRDGESTGGSPPAGGGHGLTGMAERAAAVGGEVSAGPRAGGGFEVVARLPFAADGEER